MFVNASPQYDDTENNVGLEDVASMSSPSGCDGCGCGRAGEEYAGGGGRAGTGESAAAITCAEWNGIKRTSNHRRGDQAGKYGATS